MRSWKRRLKLAVWAAAGRCNFRLLRIPPGSPAEPDRFVRVDFDFILGHYLLRRDPNVPFFFIQIGAFDGVTDDPLHEYVRRFGWRGVLLEPQGRYFSALQESYRDCPRLVLVQAALDHTSGKRTLYTISDPDAPGLPDWAAMTGSFSRTALLDNPGLPDITDLVVGEPVDTITFDELLARAATDHVDLIQVDAEGYDAEILKMIDFARVRPPIVRFEHEHLSRREYRAATQLLTSLGYRILPERFDTCAYLVP